MNKSFFQKNKIPLFSLFFLIGFFTDCTNHNKQTILGNGFCDTSNTKFAAVIQPIIQTHCNTQSGCHGGINYGSIPLESFQNIKDKYSDILSRIKSGNMPKGNPKLDDCTILKFETWVNKGAQNN